MKLIFLIISCLLFGTGFGNKATSDNCLTSIHEACLNNNPAIILDEMTKNMTICSSTFGGFPQLSGLTQTLLESHMQASMQYLLISSHFSEWDIDRKGFYNLFAKLSDDAFQDAVTLIQHMTKRGGRLTNFTVPMPENESYELGELEALSKALDIEKKLASRTLDLIHHSTHGDIRINRESDGEFAHFLADQVSDKHSVRVKSLANHVNTLSQAISHALSKNKDSSFVLHLYDTQFLN